MTIQCTLSENRKSCLSLDLLLRILEFLYELTNMKSTKEKHMGCEAGTSLNCTNTRNKYSRYFNKLHTQGAP